MKIYPNRYPERVKIFDVFDADGNSYIKYKYEGVDTTTVVYYFKRHPKCSCTDTQQCYRCSLRERPILKHLKSDDDFTREDQLKPMGRKRWITKLERIRDYKNYQSVNN